MSPTPMPRASAACRLLVLVTFVTLTGCVGARPGAPDSGPPAGLERVSTAGTAAVEVRVEVEPAPLQLALALFDSEEDWKTASPFRTVRLSVERGGVTWRVDALPPGRYAVKAYLDLDGDGALGRAAFGRPTEPFGFSSGARGAFGPPAFAAASFDLRAGETRSVTIELD